MVWDTDLKKEYYSAAEAAKMLGVTTRTIRNYKDRSIFDMKRDPGNGYWRISRDELIKLLKYKGVYAVREEKRITILYARVSSGEQKQKGDLSRQTEDLVREAAKRHIEGYEIITDTGSGLNTKRRGLQKVIRKVLEGRVDEVLVTHKDRLTRFGYEYLEELFESKGTRIQVIQGEEDKDAQEELADDMISLLASFSGKLYGIRSAKKRRARQLVESIKEQDNDS